MPSCEQAYIGKTSQHLKERIKQHIPDDLLAEPLVKTGLKVKASDSAICKHLKVNASACIHPRMHQRFCVLAKARDKQHLDVLEALFIKTLSPALFQQKEFVRLLCMF